jgi:hypothetical protein
MPCRTT